MLVSSGYRFRIACCIPIGTGYRRTGFEVWLDIEKPAVALDLHNYGLTTNHFPNRLAQLLKVKDRHAVQRSDDVPRRQSCATVVIPGGGRRYVDSRVGPQADPKGERGV